VAFLPGSQVDIRPVRDITPLMGTPQPFQILKMDRGRGNIVVSRRAVLEESRAEQLGAGANLKEGQVLEGVVKNITDYGAFVDLGGVDGLLHVTDIAWRASTIRRKPCRSARRSRSRSSASTRKPSASLGMKQLEADPWEGVEAKYPVGAKFTGRVTNITDYGAFVELEPGVEGLVHVSEMSWTKKNVHPGKIVSTSQEVEVMVLDVDPKSAASAWASSSAWRTRGRRSRAVPGRHRGRRRDQEHHRVRPVHRPARRHRRHGPPVRPVLGQDRRGSDRDFKKGEVVKAKVLDVDVEKERISLGIKQLEDDRSSEAMGDLKKGAVVTCTVTSVQDGGIEVSDGAPGFIRKAELSRDRSEQRPERFAAGEKVDAKITQIDKSGRKLIAVDQGPRGRGGEEGRRRIRLVRLGRVAGRYPGR
jgi:small subunit ribosomal protein S1